LQEAIFEVHWELQDDQNGHPFDEGFDLAVGILSQELKESFPAIERLEQQLGFVNIHVLGTPTYRYRKQIGEWPVIQLGKGILTVNDIGSEYEWQSRFRESIINALTSIHKSYSLEKRVHTIRLVYINSVVVEEGSVENYARNNLRIGIERNFDVPGTPSSFQIEQTFRLNADQLMTISVFPGRKKKSGQSTLTWTITLNQNAGGQPLGVDLMPAIDSAHRIVSEQFATMLKEEYYEGLH
jgi:uncharacterized protein (TIGR04255 family)